MPNVLATSRITSAAYYDPDFDPKLNHQLTNEVIDDKSGTTIKVEVPGVDPSAVVIDCKGDILTISCERGKFTHKVDPTVDVSKIKADIQWGLLTLTIPLPPAPVAHSIKINIHDAIKAEARKIPTKLTKEE